MFNFTIGTKDLSKIKTLLDAHNPQLLVKGFTLSDGTIQGVEKSYIATDLGKGRYLFGFPTKVDAAIPDGSVVVQGILNDASILARMGLPAA